MAALESESVLVLVLAQVSGWASAEARRRNELAKEARKEPETKE